MAFLDAATAMIAAGGILIAIGLALVVQ